jgi:hypothetical protein
MIRTNVSVIHGSSIVDGPCAWLVDVEESAAGPVFAGPYHLRRYQIPTRYRTQALAERAARELAASMGGTFRHRPTFP